MTDSDTRINRSLHGSWELKLKFFHLPLLIIFDGLSFYILYEKHLPRITFNKKILTAYQLAYLSHKFIRATVAT